MKTMILMLAAACAFTAGCATPPPSDNATRGWLAVSANDNKSVLDNGVAKVPANLQPDTLALIDMRGAQPRLVAEIEVPTSVVGPPFAVAISTDESIALVTAGKRVFNDTTLSDNLLSVVDLQASPPKLIQTAHVGAGAAGVSINREGTLALVANRDEGTVSVVRVTGKAVEVLGKVALGNDKAGPSHVALTADGKTAFVSRDGDHRISMLAIDGEKVTLAQRDLYAGQRPYAIDLCNAEIGVVGNVGQGNGDEDTIGVIDLKASPPRVIDTISVGQSPEGVACSPDGRWVA
ncbi:MAG TPA: hypothetical protein VKI18_04120, partial [Albitalea sp.]|nr:hypothetical protein [Albitalea sp.]